MLQDDDDELTRREVVVVKEYLVEPWPGQTGPGLRLREDLAVPLLVVFEVRHGASIIGLGPRPRRRSLANSRMARCGEP